MLTVWGWTALELRLSCFRFSDLAGFLRLLGFYTIQGPLTKGTLLRMDMFGVEGGGCALVVHGLQSALRPTPNPIPYVPGVGGGGVCCGHGFTLQGREVQLIGVWVGVHLGPVRGCQQAQKKTQNS